MPVAISNERAAILDPNSFIGTDKKGYDCSVKEFLKYRSHAACFESLGPCSVSPHATNYPATLFRFPLRSNRTVSKSKISSDIYSVEDVKNFLFQSFMQEAPLILLFLKHVEEISLYDGDRLLFKVSVDPSHKETVKKERNALIQLGQSYSMHMYPSLRIYAMTISVDNDSDKNYYHWLIFNMIGSTIDTICKLSQKLRFLPWVGIATLLPSKLNLSNIDVPEVDLTHLSNVLQMIQSQLTTNKIRLSMYEVEGIQRHTEGRAFCFLPLPNITHLPINIHGYFGVSDNRRTIEWPASNNTSDIAVWNQDLVLKHIAPLYSLLIGCRTKLISYKNTPLHDHNVTDAYAAWPLYSELKNEIIWSQLIKPTITSCLDFPVFWSATGKWVTMKEAVFLHEHGHGIPTTAVDILIKAKVPVVKISENIWQTLKKCKDAKLNVVTQTHVRDAYKEKFAFDSFEKFQPFLEYLLEDIHVGSKNFDELLNLKIIPVSVASRKFKLQTLKLYKSGEEIYYLTDTVSGVSKLLPGLESDLVDSVTINSDLINQKLLELAKSKKFRLQLGNSEIFCQKLLPSSIRKWSNFKHNEPITWMINRPGYPPLNWILDVWKWFSKNPDMIMKIVGIPILPKERIEENSTCCTLLPIPSKGNKYYRRSDDDMELTCIFEKLEATVISTNDFVFSHGKLSRFIFNINISNILEYLVKRPEKIYLLEETEKKRLLMHIAQTFSRIKEKKIFFHLLHELSIFQIGVGCTPVKFSSLTSECILPPLNMQFDKTLDYPHNILNITHTDVFSLLTKEINYSVMPKVKVYEKILQFALSQLQGSSSTNNGDKLITWIMKVESSKLSPELINYLSSCSFVRTQASPLEFKKPNELYDPKDDNFHILFHSDKDKVFPAEYYIKKDTLDVFVNLGLKTWEKLTSDVKMFGNFLKERAENVKKAASKKSDVSEIQVGCRILEIIGNFPKHGVDHLMSAVESVKFLKVHVSRPLDFPECLPWKGEEYGHKLVAPNQVCFEKIYSNLIGCVLPIIHDDYEKELSIQLPKKVIKKFLVPTVENVIEQLNVLIKFENIENPSKLSTIIHKIYQYLNDTPEKVSKLLPKKWVWWNYQGQFRFMPSKIFVLNFQIDLHPFMYLIKSDYSFLKDYDKLLRESGIKESPTTTDLINVLKEMSSESCHLSEDHIQMSISILDYLFQRGEGKGDVFIPTNDFKLLPVDKCTYDDREWIRKKIGLQNKDLSLNFVHGSVSPRVAEFFGVQPLSKKVAPSVFEIEEDSNIIHHVSTTCTSVKDTALASNGDTYETCLCSFFSCNDKNKTSEWLINESRVSKHLEPMLSTATKRGLQPHGATALQLRYDNKSNQGLLFHSVPLSVNSSMPVHMNAHFIVNDSHNQLATPTGFEKWNKYIFRDLLVPSYVELILQARKYIDGTINSAEWYYGLFPNVQVIVASKDNPESVSTCKCFYETLVRNNLPVLLDGRSNDGVRWLQITEGDIGYFYLPGANDSLCQILLSIGMPITHAPKFVYDNLCVGHKKSISLVTSKNVCHYLRTLTDENAVLKNVDICIQLLQFCSQDAEREDMKSFLKGIPLLLTSNNTLDSSGSLYESTFASLLPNLKEKFIHPQLGESKVVTDVLKQVVVPLPSDVVAQNILLPDTDEAMRLNSEQAKLVSQLLEFLEVSVLHQSDRVEYARQVTKSFFKKPIILSSSGLFYPLCLSKHVFDGMNDANLIKKLGCAILDTNVLKLAKTVVPLLISSTSNSDDIITCLKSDPPKTVQHQFTPDEVNRFLILLLSASNIPSNISYLLKNLPIFKTVDGSYHCLNEAKEVYFITGSLSVCAGFSELQDITQTLIIYASQMEIYKRLVPQAQYITSVQLYTNLVIPNLECFTSSKDLKKHLSVVINWISNPDEFSPDDIDNIKMVLKKTRLIDINGKKYLVSELFDPDVLFHATFNKGKLPPVNFWNGDMLAFLRSLGLQSKVDHDVWLHSAKQVAEEGSAVELRLLPVELVKKSEALLKVDQCYRQHQQDTSKLR